MCNPNNSVMKPKDKYYTFDEKDYILEVNKNINKQGITKIQGNISSKGLSCICVNSPDLIQFLKSKIKIEEDDFSDAIEVKDSTMMYSSMARKRAFEEVIKWLEEKHEQKIN
jgi:hypothetical protein